MLFVYLAICFISGVFLSWLWFYKKTHSLMNENIKLTAQLEISQNTHHQLSTELNQKEQKIENLIKENSELNTRIETQNKLLEEQKKFLEQMQEKFKDTFSALASQALRTNSEEFLKTAKQLLDKIVAESKGELGKHKEAMNAIVNPLKETLENYQKYLREIEKNRNESYGELKKHLTEISQLGKELQEKTTQLSTALRNPKVAGRWGELTLRRVVDLAGLSEYCDFDEQTAVNKTDRLRPDMIVHLPNDRVIAIDSKMSFDSYINALNATSEAEREKSLREYSRTIKSHIRNLSSREYWSQFEKDSLEFVVLFLPGESFFESALRADNTIIEYALDNKVLLASPITLIALLRAIAYGWRQEKLAQSAEKIRQLGEEFYERITKFTEHLESVGKSLQSTIENYNNAVGSLERRVLPSARRFREYGIKTKSQLPEEIKPISNQPRLPEQTSMEP